MNILKRDGSEVKFDKEKIKENLREWNTLSFFYVYNSIKKVYNKIKRNKERS